ncbi:MAG: hypothetical protein AB8G15_01560 [Saprospiraceae bacterium]
MKKNIKLKPRETMATNSDFYNLFRPIAPSIEIIGRVAQIISALTEAITVWYITQSEMVGTSKFISILVSILAMVLVIAILELGGRKFLQVLTRAIIWKRLKNPWYIALFSIVTTVTIGMGVLSFNLSTNGIHHAFVSNVPTIPNFDDSDLKSEFRSNKKEITSQFEKDFDRLDVNYKDRIKNVKEQYQARIDATEIKVKQYLRKYNSGEKWAKSQADKFAKKGTILKTEKTAMIVKIQEEHTKLLTEAQAARDQALVAERGRLNEATLKGETALLKVHGHQSKKANFWGSLFSFFVGFSVLLAFICIVSVEVYRRGAGIEVTYEEEEKEESILMIFWLGLTARFDHFFRKRVERFANITTPSHRANVVGFNPQRNLVTNEAQLNMQLNTEDKKSEGRQERFDG